MDLQKVTKHGEKSHPAKREEKPVATPKEVPSIRLSPEQIEEIHSDEYSLMVFYAVRIEPLSLQEIKRQLPEPEAKKAQSVIDRFLKAGLIHVTQDNKYYSNFPENYINYSAYKYDALLEQQKDEAVFKLMKQQTGNQQFWKDKSYFSIDAFFSPEQTAELQELFDQIRNKSKEFSNMNAKTKSIKGLKFRHIKLYDVTLSLLIMLFCTFGFASHSFASGGNDPKRSAQMSVGELAVPNCVPGNPDPRCDTGGGHDPKTKGPIIGGGHDPKGPRQEGPIIGGGHDPKGTNNSTCQIQIDGKLVLVESPSVCKLKKLIERTGQCDQQSIESCDEALNYLNSIAE